MVNKKIFTLISILSMLYFVTGTYPVFSYTTDTHSYLTKEIFDFYNSKSKNKIDKELLPYLIDGSRKEDDTPRFMNHFYDPINNVGLHRDTAIDPTYYFGTYPSAKEWALKPNTQNLAIYKVSSAIASILTAIQKQKISEITTESDFTWNKALKYWISGEKEKAMFTLGHIIHLIEDLSVPAHTRNDPHSEGDPYEQWADRFILSNPDNNLKERLKNKDIIHLSNIGDYFDRIANYSNNNFYSKDTIGIQSGYSMPTVDYEEKDGRFIVGIKELGNKKIKIYIKDLPTVLTTLENKNNIKISLEKIGGDAVLKNNWSLLSTKAVQYGAGVIDLFFQEAERNKNNPNFITSNKKSFLGKVLDSISNAIGSIFGKQKLQKISEIPISETPINPTEQETDNQPNNTITRNTPTDENTENNPPEAKIQTIQNEETENQTEETDKQKEKEYTVVKVIDGDTIVLDNGDIVRYIGIDAPELEPKPQCYAEESTNINKKLVLNKKVKLTKAEQEKDSYGRLVRYVWVGDNLINEEIIRLGGARAYNFGHQHPLDSEFKKTEQEAKDKQIGMWGKICQQNKEEKTKEEGEENTTTPKKEACKYETNLQPIHTPVIINEVAWMGTSENSNDEWIELRNLTESEIDITGWTLVDKDEQIQIVFGNNKEKTYIEPNGYYLLERTDDSSVPNIKADAIYKGALSNSKEGIRLFNSNCQLIDEVKANDKWPAGDNSSKRTMERNRHNLWWHSSYVRNGTPKRENTLESTGGGSSSGGSYSGGSPNQNQDNNNTGNSNENGDENGENSANNTPANIVINEVMYNLEGADSGREWIEVKNNSTSTADLSEYKLFENETKHSINPIDSSSTPELYSEEYAVIADDPQKFKEDWPSYEGKLFDSSFSLNNSTETIALYYGDEEIDTLTYSSDTGADGNGKSLQYFEDGWTEATPTPGEENKKGERDNQQEISAPTHIVISEVQISGNEADDEFIELYNPTENEIYLNGYSLQYISGKATTTSNVYKKNLPEEITISPLSFVLLSQKNSCTANMSDETYSFSLSGLETGGHIFIVSTTTEITSFDDPTIVDSISYGDTTAKFQQNIQLPPDRNSIERKAISAGKCVSSQNEGEFLGNACYTKSSEDFEVRENPNPQNSSSLPEPRQAPPKPENLTLEYSSSSISLISNWKASSASASSTITFKISDIETNTTISTTTLTSSNIRIYEVNKIYNLGVSACDSDGLCSEQAISSINIPSFIGGLYAYEYNLENSSTTMIEMFYEDYPFIPQIFNRNQWSLIVFYLNSEPIQQKIIYDSPGSQWKPDNTDNVIEIEYPNCSGVSNSKNISLILPNTEGFCGTSGGAYNSAMDFEKIGDHHFVIYAPNITSSDKFNADRNNYITIALYSTQSTKPSDGRVPYFGLAAIDSKQYTIGTQPERQAPTLSGDIQVSFNENTSGLRISWHEAEDYDTLQSLISYEIQTSSSSDWVNVGTATSTELSTSPDDVLSISVRARDEFDNVSNTIGPVEWSYPTAVIVFQQNEQNSESITFGDGLDNNNQYVSSQTIKPAERIEFNMAELKIDHSYGSHEAQLALSIYEDNGNGRPDINNKIAEALVKGLATSGITDYTFNFNNTISLDKDTTYWFVVGIKSSPQIIRANRWKIAVSNADPYKDGKSYRLYIKNGNEINQFYEATNEDWYIILRKRQ